MATLGPNYGSAWNELAPSTEYFQQGGIDPAYTSLAMALGYRPNPFAPAGTEGEAQMRFLSVLKNVMDQQMGGPEGRAAQISPGNPAAGMPYGMEQYLNLAGALMNSAQGRALMPGSQAAMMQNGYAWGPINATDPSALQQLIMAARTANPGRVVGAGPEFGGGQSQVPGGTPGTPLPAAPPSNALPAAPPSNSQVPAPTGPTGADAAGPPDPNSVIGPSAGQSNQTVLANALRAKDTSMDWLSGRGPEQRDNIIGQIMQQYPGVPPVIAQGVANNILPPWILGPINDVSSNTQAILQGQR